MEHPASRRRGIRQHGIKIETELREEPSGEVSESSFRVFTTSEPGGIEADIEIGQFNGEINGGNSSFKRKHSFIPVTLSPMPYDLAFDSRSLPPAGIIGPNQ